MIEISVFGVYVNAQWVCHANTKFLGAALLARQSAIESVLSSLSKGHDVRFEDRSLGNIGAYIQSITRINGYVYAIVVPNVAATVVNKDKSDDEKDAEKKAKNDEQSVVWHEDGVNVIWEKISDMVETPLLQSWKNYVMDGLQSPSLLREARQFCGFPDIPGDRLIMAELAGEAEGWRGATIKLEANDVTSLVMHGLEQGRLDPYAD
ncbi:hypothetical protein [Acidithiobacillus thiooxidans]|uniref:hypothetical protein n=1 Tax=Acidithiobacillus thiooxidans TaxID=930 RepID=UPI0004E1BAD5|nr:hypothetical protein [Acidithiobacillus thiooxidans]